MQVQNKWAWLLFFSIALIWGSSFIMMKRGLEVFAPAQIAAIRIASAGLLLFPLSLKSWHKLKRQQWLYLFLSGFMGTLIPAFLFPLAQTQLPSSIAGVLNATVPMFTFILGGLFFQQRLDKATAFGLLIGFLGATTLLLFGSSGELDFNRFGLFVLLATLLYGFNANWVKYKLEALRGRDIAILSLGMMLPFAAVALWQTEVYSTWQQEKGATEALAWIVLLGVLATAIALLLFNQLIKMDTAVFASSVAYLIPLVALMWGILDGENIFWPQWLGMAAILLGVYLVSRRKG